MTLETSTGREYQIWVVDDEESIFKYNEKILLICLRVNNEDTQFFGVRIEIIDPKCKIFYINFPTIIELHKHEKTVTTFKEKSK